MTSADDPAAYEVVNWESWVEASRMDFDPAWFDRQVINANAIYHRHGWKGVEVVYVKERTTWLRRNFTFEIRGERYCVENFRNAMTQLATNIF